MKAIPPHLERIVLTGFMGSGKTTVGRLLAEELRWSFQDLDAAVEARLGLAIPEIFRTRGEEAFRTAEVGALAELLDGTQTVIALGGGAAASLTVRRLLAETPETAVVHLHAAFDILEERCRHQAQDPAATARPLIQDAVAARVRYAERSPLYAALAHLGVDVSRSEPPAVVEEILVALAGSPDSCAV